MFKINKSKNILNIFSLYICTILFINKTTLNTFFSQSIIPDIIKIAYISCCILCVVLFFNYTLREILLIAILFFIFFIVAIKSSNFYFLELLLTTLFLKDIPLSKIAKRILYIQIIFFLSVLVLYILRILPDIVSIRSGVIRSSLGFSHPNTPGMFLFSILILVSILIDNKVTKAVILSFFIILGVTIFSYTNSRSSILILGSVLLVNVGNSFFSKFKLYIFNFKYFIPIIFTSFTLISYIASILYGKGNLFVKNLDTFLTGRISLGYKFIREYGFSIFGQNISYGFWTEGTVFSKYRFLDNVYLKVLLNYGVVIFLVFLIYFTFVSLSLEKKQLLHWNSYLFLFLCLGLSEQTIFDYWLNFFMLYGVIFFCNRKIKIKQ